MRNRPILITGANGLLGANLVAEYHASDIPVAALHGSRHCDLRDPRAVKAAFDRYRPGAVIHCAALTDVDDCESHAEDAWLTNVEASRNVATAASVYEAQMVYISSDAVFGGARGCWREEDEPRPVNVYARSKREGEIAVQREDPGALIVRTNLYGWNLQRRAGKRPSIAEWIIERLEAGLEVPGFTDVVFSPILANHLAAPLLELLRDRRSGVFHVAGSWSGSKFEFACRLADMFGFDRTDILPARLADVELKAPRALNTALNVDRIHRTLGAPMPGLDDGLRRFRTLRSMKELAHV